jgi:hypothetical protein
VITAYETKASPDRSPSFASCSPRAILFARPSPRRLPAEWGEGDQEWRSGGDRQIEAIHPIRTALGDRKEPEQSGAGQALILVKADGHASPSGPIHTPFRSTPGGCAMAAHPAIPALGTGASAPAAPASVARGCPPPATCAPPPPAELPPEEQPFAPAIATRIPATEPSARPAVTLSHRMIPSVSNEQHACHPAGARHLARSIAFRLPRDTPAVQPLPTVAAGDSTVESGSRHLVRDQPVASAPENETNVVDTLQVVVELRRLVARRIRSSPPPHAPRSRSRRTTPAGCSRWCWETGPRSSTCRPRRR